MRAALLVVTAATTIALCLLAPLRQLSGDTVPARLGGLVLRCSGSFDLSRIDWLGTDNHNDVVYYYQYKDHADGYSSVFGPGPALAASLSLGDFGDGDVISDGALRRRERAAGAVLVAIAVVLLILACRARTSWLRAAAAGAIAVLSYAGAATLGQGLWQATVGLPMLVGGLALVAWRAQFPRLALLAPAVLLCSVLLRPNVLPLALGIGVMWGASTRERKNWLIAAGLAAFVAVPFVFYNATHFNSPLPLGQWMANKRISDHHVFGIRGIAEGLAGLLVSPARGLLWFAPVAIVGAARSPRPIALALVAYLIVMAAFFKWHGGQAYGPRLLSEGVWIALYGACTVRLRLLAPTAAVTILVGQLGLWLYHPEQWEARRRPEADPSAFWDLVDNPIFATFDDVDPRTDASDSPPTASYRCEHERVYTH
jgi:hypothetical protein